MKNPRPRLTAREIGIRLMLIGGSVAFAFLILEIAFRLILPDRQLRYRTDQQVLWYYRENQVGTNPQPDGSPSADIRINSLGLRGPEFSGDKEQRVLLLGDSFTFGSGVGDDETFSARLDRALGAKGTAVNGGQPGYGVFQMEGTLRRVGARIRPSAVVVVMWQGDFLRQPLAGADLDRFFATKRKTELLKSSVLVTHLYRALERVLLRAGANNLVVQVGDRAIDPGAAGQSVVQQNAHALEQDLPRLLAMQTEARKYGRGLILVLWAKEGYATVPAAEAGLSQALTDTLSAFAQQHEIPFITMQPALGDIPSSRLLIPQDYHPTAFAHCLAARHIAAQLSNMGIAFESDIACQ